MAKFCGKCGSEIKNGASFCAVCGTPIENVPIKENQSTKNSNKIRGIVACLIVVAVLTAGIIAIVNAVSGGGNYEEVARNFALADVSYNYEELFKYTAFDAKKMQNDYFEYVCDLNGKSISELYEELENKYDVSVNDIDDMFKCIRLDREEDLRDDYGNYTVSAETIDSHELSRSEWESVIDDFNLGMKGILDFDDYLDTSKIKKGYEVEVKVIIDGEEDYDTYVNTYTVVKYKGKWKVLKASFPNI